MTQLYCQPVGRVGNPRDPQVDEALSGIDTYTIEEVPMKPFTTSEENKLREVFTVARSERRLESRACFKSSAGFKVITTTTERMATNAKTTKSSIRVKEFLFPRMSCRTCSGIQVFEIMDSGSPHRGAG